MSTRGPQGWGPQRQWRPPQPPLPSGRWQAPPGWQPPPSRPPGGRLPRPPTRVLVAIGVLAVVLLAAAIGGGLLAEDDDEADDADVEVGIDTTVPETTPTSPAPESPPPGDGTACLPVPPHLLDDLGIPEAAAVRAPEDVHLRADGTDEVWYVSDSSRATWATNIDPEGEDAAGLLLPLNDAARATSEAGVDVPPDAPVLELVDGGSAEAAASRECAAG